MVIFVLTGPGETDSQIFASDPDEIWPKNFESLKDL